MKIKKLLYLVPYFIILLLGVWYRMHGSSVAFLDGDSGNYLLPPFIKKLTGEWHKGERPMAYLQFIYCTLSKNNQLNYTLLWQQIISLSGAAFLAGAWVLMVAKLKRPEFLLHGGGYLLLMLYVTSPELVYYEQFIGPEAISIAIMSILIFCLTLIFSNSSNGPKFAIILSITVFVNLYLSAFLNKWIFASVFLELFLVYLLIKKSDVKRISKILLLVLPHLFYFSLVTIPEKLNKIDSPFHDRLFIEYKQMAFTHFNILAQDKANFNLPPSLQNSLMQYYYEAQMAQPNFLIGFDSDVLMWGKANDSINSYFKGDFDSLNQFYTNLNWILATKYPLELTKDILKQAAAFYVPNRFIHKELYAVWLTFAENYKDSPAMAHRFDGDLMNYLEYFYNWSNNDSTSKEQVCKNYCLERNYPATLPAGGPNNKEVHRFLNYQFADFSLWFDYFFISAMLLFFTAKIYNKELVKPDANTLFFFLILIYVFTVGIVHTFDINRFTFTLFPFLLVTTFISGAYVCSTVWQQCTKNKTA